MINILAPRNVQDRIGYEGDTQCNINIESYRHRSGIKTYRFQLTTTSRYSKKAKLQSTLVSAYTNRTLAFTWSWESMHKTWYWTTQSSCLYLPHYTFGAFDHRKYRTNIIFTGCDVANSAFPRRTLCVVLLYAQAKMLPTPKEKKVFRTPRKEKKNKVLLGVKPSPTPTPPLLQSHCLQVVYRQLNMLYASPISSHVIIKRAINT